MCGYNLISTAPDRRPPESAGDRTSSCGPYADAGSSRPCYSGQELNWEQQFIAFKANDQNLANSRCDRRSEQLGGVPVVMLAHIICFILLWLGIVCSRPLFFFFGPSCLLHAMFNASPGDSHSVLEGSSLSLLLRPSVVNHDGIWMPYRVFLFVIVWLRQLYVGPIVNHSKQL